MKKIILIIIITLISEKVVAQSIMSDWKKLNDSISLKEYVINNAYEFLKFDPKVGDTINEYDKAILEKSSNKKVIIRDVASVKADRPALIINDTPTLNYDLLTKIKMRDIKEIRILKPNESTWSVFGVYGKIGVIMVKIKKKKWRKLKKIR